MLEPLGELDNKENKKLKELRVLLVLVSVLIYLGCDKSPTENSEDPSDIHLELYQHYGDTLHQDLGEFEFNVNNTINLQETANKEISFNSLSITIHTQTENPVSLSPIIFIILENDLDSTYTSISLNLYQYASIYLPYPLNLNFDGSIYAFLVSDIEDQIEDPIDVIIEVENYIDTLTILPNQHTFDLDVSLSIESNSLDLAVTDQLSMIILNNSEKMSGVIMNYCYTELNGSRWSIKTINVESGCHAGSNGAPLSEYFIFYGFHLN